MTRNYAAALTTLLLLSGIPKPLSAFAQTGLPDDIRQVQQRLERIEEKLKLLESRLDALEGTAAGTPEDSTLENRLEAVGRRVRNVEAPEKAKAPPATAGPAQDFRRSGFSIQPDRNFQLRVGGLLQADSRWFPGPSGAGPDTFFLRRARMILEGTVYRNFDFRIMPDFGNGQVVLQDMRIDVKSLPFATLRFGKFKVPLGLERLQSPAEILFAERALPTSLAPNRSIGIEAFRDLWGGAVQYAVGVFNGTPDNAAGPDFDTNNGKDFAGRIFLLPFKNGTADIMKGLGFGIAGSAGRQQGDLPSYRSAGQAIFFQYSPGVSAYGQRYRLSPQGYYYSGPWGLLGEYVAASQEIRKGIAVSTTRNRAWQVAGSHVFGGKASYGGAVPAREFDPRTGGLGALEFAARYSELGIDAAAFAGGYADAAVSARMARAWAVGLNWHLVRQVKFVLNYEQTRFSGGRGRGDRNREHAVLTRFQVGF